MRSTGKLRVGKRSMGSTQCCKSQPAAARLSRHGSLRGHSPELAWQPGTGKVFCHRTYVSETPAFCHSLQSSSSFLHLSSLSNQGRFPYSGSQEMPDPAQRHPSAQQTLGHRRGIHGASILEDQHESRMPQSACTIRPTRRPTRPSGSARPTLIRSVRNSSNAVCPIASERQQQCVSTNQPG